MDRSKISKDLTRLLIEQYFDLNTYYKCQFVCKYYLNVVLNNPDKVTQAKYKHYQLELKKKYDKKVELDILYEMRSICDEMDFGNKSKKEIKREKTKIRNSLYLCKNCGIIVSSYIHDCVAEDNSAFCKLCDVTQKNHACPLKKKRCDFMKNTYYYTFWTQHSKLKKSITMCNSEGCVAELKHHQKTCKRQCLNCEEYILLEKMQKHLKKCQPHLIACGILDTTTYCTVGSYR
jgi:hypothetical protein